MMVSLKGMVQRVAGNEVLACIYMLPLPSSVGSAHIVQFRCLSSSTPVDGTSRAQRTVGDHTFVQCRVRIDLSVVCHGMGNLERGAIWRPSITPQASNAIPPGSAI